MENSFWIHCIRPLTSIEDTYFPETIIRLNNKAVEIKKPPLSRHDNRIYNTETQKLCFHNVLTMFKQQNKYPSVLPQHDNHIYNTEKLKTVLQQCVNHVYNTQSSTTKPQVRSYNMLTTSTTQKKSVLLQCVNPIDSIQNSTPQVCLYNMLTTNLKIDCI